MKFCNLVGGRQTRGVSCNQPALAYGGKQTNQTGWSTEPSHRPVRYGRVPQTGRSTSRRHQKLSGLGVDPLTGAQQDGVPDNNVRHVFLDDISATSYPPNSQDARRAALAATAILHSVHAQLKLRLRFAVASCPRCAPVAQIIPGCPDTTSELLGQHPRCHRVRTSLLSLDRTIQLATEYGSPDTWEIGGR